MNVDAEKVSVADGYKSVEALAWQFLAPFELVEGLVIIMLLIILKGAYVLSKTVDIVA